MKECITILEGKEFNLKICHRKTHFHSCPKIEFVRKSTKSSSKILIFISKTFYARKYIWKIKYEPWMQIAKRREDVICVICKDGQTSFVPSILSNLKYIFEEDYQYKEELYKKLIIEPGKVNRSVSN